MKPPRGLFLYLRTGGMDTLTGNISTGHTFVSQISGFSHDMSNARHPGMKFISLVVISPCFLLLLTDILRETKSEDQIHPDMAEYI